MQILSVTECVTQGFWVLQGVKASFSPMPELCNRMMSSKCAFSLDDDRKMCHNGLKNCLYQDFKFFKDTGGLPHESDV